MGTSSKDKPFTPRVIWRRLDKLENRVKNLEEFNKKLQEEARLREQAEDDMTLGGSGGY